MFVLFWHTIECHQQKHPNVLEDFECEIFYRIFGPLSEVFIIANFAIENQYSINRRWNKHKHTQTNTRRIEREIYERIQICDLKAISITSKWPGIYVLDKESERKRERKKEKQYPTDGKHHPLSTIDGQVWSLSIWICTFVNSNDRFTLLVCVNVLPLSILLPLNSDSHTTQYDLKYVLPQSSSIYFR